jgi:hypothetical protein
MPQIKGPAMRDFLAFVKDHGVNYRSAQVPVKDLKATQRDIIPKLVGEVLADGFHRRSQKRPVLASADNYILDGHHRWAAWLLDDPNVRMKLIQIMAPIRDVLKLAKAFPGVQYSTRTAEARVLEARWKRLTDQNPDLWQPLQ